MTDKEWLEDLKDQYHFYVEKGIAFNLEHSDIEKLFMQAERAQELEEIVDKAEAHLLRNGKEIMELTNEKAELKYQNQRYKQGMDKAVKIMQDYAIGDVDAEVDMMYFVDSWKGESE